MKRKSFQQIPRYFRQQSRFLVWKQEGNQKIPLTACGGGVKPTDSTSRVGLMSFQRAKEIAEQHNLGLGFSFIPPDHIIGFDIDFDPFEDDSALSRQVLELMNWIYPYIEYSPSGEGFHFYFRVDEEFEVLVSL